MQIHRFHDLAGISLMGRGETRYLTADEAEKVGRGLLAIAASIRREGFGQSPNLTVRFESHPHGPMVNHKEER